MFNEFITVALRSCNNLISKTAQQKASGNYSGAILSYHQFIEGFISGFVESNSQFKIYSKYREASQQLIVHLNDNYNEYFIQQFGNFPISASFPVLIHYAQILAVANPDALELIGLIKESQSIFKSNCYPQNKKLDSLRNAIAHEGVGVSKENFMLYEHFIKTCYHTFIPGDDPFVSINNFIEDFL